MGCQISLAEQIKILQSEIEEHKPYAKTEEAMAFLRAEMAILDSLIKQKEEEVASKPVQPKEVHMPKRPKEPKHATSRAVPLQAAPDEKIVAEVQAAELVDVKKLVVIDPATGHEYVLPESFSGERYLNYKHPDTGRNSGKAMTWEDAKVWHLRKLLRYRKKLE